MLNASSGSLSSSGHCNARLHQKGGRKHAKQKSFKERYFPFHRLPREIIAEIFVLCLPDFEVVFNCITKKAAPILLCNVSSSWRSLALSIPRLWSELSIIINPRLNIDLAISMAESWIGRSGELPLSLRLRGNPWNERGEAMTQAHLNTFFRYASRWESVDISGLMSPHVVPFPEFGPTPLLREFSYSILVPWRAWLPCPFTSCPLLSAFSWPSSCSPASNRKIPWHQLTHITMEAHMTIYQTLNILRACKMLVEFNVGLDCGLDFDQVRRPVENRSLRSFHICVYITCSDLLQSLTLPALTDFSLITDYESPNSISTHSVHTELLRLFTRSRCKLETLELENCGFNDACILECLQHECCSSLTKLKIANVEDRPMFTDRVILALTNKDDLLEANNVLLPKLSYLSLDTCVSASPGVLGDMVLERCFWGVEVGQLKSLTLLIGVLDDTDHRYLKMAEKLGLNVYIEIFYPDTESEFIEDS